MAAEYQGDRPVVGGLVLVRGVGRMQQMHVAPNSRFEKRMSEAGYPKAK